MNPLRSPCLLLATLGAVAGCGVNTAMLNPLDGGTVADAPTAEPAVNDAPTRDTLAVVADVAADAGNPIVDAGTPQVDVPAADTPATGALGTCASPVDLGLEGTVAGTDLVFRGVTTGLADVLHPYPGCVAHDAAEMVMTYRVPAGAGALMFTTEGSAYDTVLYVRAACSQAKTGVDTTCNNDSYDHAPQSTVYVTNAVEGQTLFLIVDGNTEVDTVPTGSFVLTARRVPFGGSGQPCNPVTDPATARCSGALMLRGRRRRRHGDLRSRDGCRHGVRRPRLHQHLRRERLLRDGPGPRRGRSCDVGVRPRGHALGRSLSRGSAALRRRLRVQRRRPGHLRPVALRGHRLRPHR